MSRATPIARSALALAALSLSGCTACDATEGPLRVEGPPAFVRCHAALPPSDGAERFGRRTLTRDGRALALTGARDPARLAAMAGPVDEAAWSSVTALAPDLAIVIGALPRRVPRLPYPVLLLAGGDDAYPGYAVAADGERVLDLTVYRTLRVGGVELLVVPGAPGGRYARTADACGASAADLAGWVPTGDAESPRALLAWAGPTGARGLEGREAGSTEVARLAAGAGADAVVFAWPRESAGSAEGAPLRVGLRPASGPWAHRSDDARVAPGPTLLLLSSEGLAVAPDSP